MAFPARVIRVLIASPGDCGEERQGLAARLDIWNLAHAEDTGFYLVPWMWETCSYSVYGQEGQYALDDQIVAVADLCIAFFKKRLGTKTKTHESGTVQEIEGSIANGLKPSVYFIDDGTPNPDHKEAGRLEKYQAKIRKNSYAMTVPSGQDAVNKAMVFVDLEIKEMAKAAVEVAEAEAALVEEEARQPEQQTELTEPTEQKALTSSTPGSVRIAGKVVQLPDGKQMEREANRLALSRLDTIAEMVKNPTKLPTSGELARSVRNIRRMTRTLKSMDELTSGDWEFEGNGAGWVLTNTSGLPIVLGEYAVLGPKHGSKARPTLAESDESLKVEPGEKVRIDAGDAEGKQLDSALIEITYKADGDLSLTTGTLKVGG